MTTAGLKLDGNMFIAGRRVAGAEPFLRPIAAADGKDLCPVYGSATDEDIDTAARAASKAFTEYRYVPPEMRARLLELIADRLEGLGETLLERAQQESALPPTRLISERGRTCAQLRMFADFVRRGDALGVRIDPADPRRQPLPRPDLRLQHIPVGPVAVFGASNFPLAFSVAGGDTASALAAGCPVIVKGHEAHLGTSELVGRVITEAVRELGLPAGVFSLLFGDGPGVGQALVRHPAISAVGFTGSRQGGLALRAAAFDRPVPIPVFAEMSSVNPVLITEGALEGNSNRLAEGFAGSLTLGAGQFCTNPGVVFVPECAAGDMFSTAAATLLDSSEPQTMLTPGIAEAYRRGVDRLRTQPGVRELTSARAADQYRAAPVLFLVDVNEFVRNPALAEEIFGPAAIIVRVHGSASLEAALGALPGQLTVTIHAAEGDHSQIQALLPSLEQLAGRILFGGWPTGVEVTDAMVHGGPFPATSDSRTTSVGTLAIERFLRPVTYQDMPTTLQPLSVRDDNALNIVRRVNGQWDTAGR
ncbi:MAG: aldehyde dehydrogenase (NADP(+)) [Mycobacterium sp.]